MFQEISKMLTSQLTAVQIIRYLPVILEVVTIALNKGNGRLSEDSAIEIQILIEKIRKGII